MFKRQLSQNSKKIRIISNIKGQETEIGYFQLTLELSEYRDFTGIFYGYLELKIHSFFPHSREYRITAPIIGKKNKISSHVSGVLKDILETFINDYEYMASMKPSVMEFTKANKNNYECKWIHPVAGNSN